MRSDCQWYTTRMYWEETLKCYIIGISDDDQTSLCMHDRTIYCGNDVHISCTIIATVMCDGIREKESRR